MYCSLEIECYWITQVVELWVALDIWRSPVANLPLDFTIWGWKVRVEYLDASPDTQKVPLDLQKTLNNQSKEKTIKPYEVALQWVKYCWYCLHRLAAALQGTQGTAFHIIFNWKTLHWRFEKRKPRTFCKQSMCCINDLYIACIFLLPGIISKMRK